jgi:hypothetical protein
MESVQQQQQQQQLLQLTPASILDDASVVAAEDGKVKQIVKQ